jgi:predicted DNA-binding ribbon-helix-helix protein
MPSAPAHTLLKRSLAIAGHRTSLALEPEFWAALDSIAVRQGLSIAQLIAEIDARRGAETPGRALASACRVFALLNVAQATGVHADHAGPT